jgi:hypothetical protein
MTTRKQLVEELDALNATMNDETDDSPELLAEQERLLDAITAAEAADLTALSTNQLIAHFTKVAPSERLTAWKGSKAQLIAKINAQSAAPMIHTAVEPGAQTAVFNAAVYAAQHGLNPRELRQQLRAAGFKAPYTRVLISTEFSCASRTLMHETGYRSADRHRGRSISW